MPSKSSDSWAEDEAMKPIHSTDALTIGGHAFDSRLLIGTGKYPADDMIPKIIAASGSQIITVALRRVDFEATTDNVMIIDRGSTLFGCFISPVGTANPSKPAKV